MSFKYAKRVDTMEVQADIVRKLFNSMTDPETISFGGGAPAKETFPVDEIRQIADDVLRKDTRGYEALQYSNPIGDADLRQAIVDILLPRRGVTGADPNNVLITVGGLETMNLVSQIFLDPGDILFVESPTFVHCMEIFKMFQVNIVAVETDDDGMVIEDLEKKYAEMGGKMVYVIPTFQNPSGRTMSLERRKALAEFADREGVLVIEDDPYVELRVSGEDLPAIKSFDKTGHVILANSFSKIFSPGSRLGYVYADPEIIFHLFDAKTATNSHTSTLVQILCAEYFKKGYFDEHIAFCRDFYRKKRDKAIECLTKYMPEGTKINTPDGGLFIWVELPKGKINTTKLLEKALENKVSFIAGEGFFMEGGGMGDNCMRISFGALSDEDIEKGLSKLGALIQEEMQ